MERRIALCLILTSLVLVSCSEGLTDYRLESCTSAGAPLAVSDNSVTLTGAISSAHVAELAALTPDRSVLRFENSPGGSIAAATQLVTQFEQVRVTGAHCNSACVMMLTGNDNVCVEPSVQFISFHSISKNLSLQTGHCLKAVSARQTQSYVATLPPGLQHTLRALHTQDMTVTITLNEFLSYYPDKLCPA